MKIHDLFEETHSAYVKRLTKELNIKKLGRGAFATVFQHPSHHDIAVRVTQDDTVYLHYAEFCKGKNNPWLPSVIDIVPVNFDDKHADGYIVFLKKLEPASANDVQKAIAFIYDDLGLSNPPKNFSDFTNEVWRKIEKDSSDQHLRQAARYLISVGFADEENNSLIDDNVMKRTDGHLVFNDI